MPSDRGRSRFFRMELIPALDNQPCRDAPLLLRVDICLRALLVACIYCEVWTNQNLRKSNISILGHTSDSVALAHRCNREARGISIVKQEAIPVRTAKDAQVHPLPLSRRVSRPCSAEVVARPGNPITSPAIYGESHILPIF